MARLILVNRSWRLSMILALVERRNRTLVWILYIASLFLVLLLAIPALRELFRFGAILASDALIVLVAGFASVVWFEIYKLIVTRRFQAIIPTSFS